MEAEREREREREKEVYMNIHVGTVRYQLALAARNEL